MCNTIFICLFQLYDLDPPAGGRSPSIDGYPIQDTIAGIGETVQLPCVADGWPLPTYRWYKDGVELDVNEERYAQFGGHLVIQPTRLTDRGEYRCNASNSRGSAAAIRTLIVKGISVYSDNLQYPLRPSKSYIMFFYQGQSAFLENGKF